MQIRRIPFALSLAALGASVTWMACGGDSDPACRPAVEVCNGQDDDCDGQVDETFDVGGACTVGVGACAAAGQEVCAAGGATTECDAVPGMPSAESCNQVDDDCDGQADQGLPDCCQPSSTRACGADVGVCQAGVETCSGGGAWGPCLLAGQPVILPGAQAEICNGLDDDCDGQADDGFGLGAACTTGVGACAASGAMVCTPDESGSACDATPGTPAAETCNGLDDDCDAATDEEVAGPLCEDQDGVCAGASKPAALCQGGAWTPCTEAVYAGHSAAYQPGELTCDGLDNDCDGQVDEGFPVGNACSVGVGACLASGVVTCTASGPTCSATPGDPRPELCNGVDDDCDGSTDEDYPLVGSACFVGVGLCTTGGTWICKADGTGTACSATPGDPRPELCNGVDDDCDGSTDEDVVRPPCEKQAGVCAGALRPVSLCQGGAWTPCTDATYAAHSAAYQPAEAACDGLDNDCDGSVDEAGCP